MTDKILGRIQEDLAVMQRAMRLSVPFGKGMLVCQVLMTSAAAIAAIFSLFVKSDLAQQIPFTAYMVTVPIGMLVLSRRTNHDVKMQIVMSLTTYAVVWIAASGYMMAFWVGPSLGVLRAALLYSTSVLILMACTAILVRAALKRREQYYCLGLATAAFVSGMSLPILGQSYGYS
ncbi:MAG: hypothetical protein U0930_15960, partial [Pirellulales bacterium]